MTPAPTPAPTPVVPPPAPARRSHPWRPDVTVCFTGTVTGYGLLARRLVEVERAFAALGPTSEFRCHRTGRRLRLVGRLPLAATRELRDLARVGRALGMHVVCTVSLPEHACDHGAVTELARTGGISSLALDLSGLTVETAPCHAAAAAAWIDVAALLGMDVEVRGPMPVVHRTGVLRSPWLDRTGFTVLPAPPGRPPPDPPGVLCVGLDGAVHAGERAWRAGAPPVGSLHVPATELDELLRRVVTAGRP